jgi:L-lysine 6-transaminase
MTAPTPASAHETLARWLPARGLPLVCDLERSKGPFLHDARSGKDYLDFSGFGGTRALAFNHRRLLEPDLIARLGQASLHDPGCGGLHTAAHASFLEAFAATALGGEYRRVGLAPSHPAALRGAVEAALAWKARSSALPARVVALRSEEAGPSAPGWTHLATPALPSADASSPDHLERERTCLDALEALLPAGGHDVAAVVVETIDVGGGDLYLPASFLPSLRRLCDERGCVLIVDETHTGFGVTGKWWDCQNLGVRPDVLVFGGKAQVCGFACAERLEGGRPDPADFFTSGEPTVYPLASATAAHAHVVRAHRILDIVVGDHLLEHAAVMGRYLLKLLRELVEQHPTLSSPRGRGLWVAFDLADREQRDRLLDACFREELLLEPCGPRSLGLRPSLDIGPDAIGRSAAQLEAAVLRTEGRSP